MMSHPTPETSSPYYPRRARWYTRLWYPWNEFKRLTLMDRVRLPGHIALGDFILSFLLPGYGLIALRWKKTGLAVMAAYLLCLAGFVVLLGTRTANACFGLMISMHATSIGMVLNRWIAEVRLRYRMAVSLLVLLTLATLIYFPLRNRYLERFIPLRIAGRALVFVRATDATLVRRGEVIAYQIHGDRDIDPGGSVIVAEGYGAERVLGLPGDRVRFEAETFAVNGIPQPRRREMPQTGEVVVPENHWFVWPNFAIRNVQYAGTNVAGLLMRQAMVAQKDFIGRAARHWFGRAQTLP